MIRQFLTLMAVGGCVALVACGSDDEGERFGSSDSFCQALAEAECGNGVSDACGVTKDRCELARKSACNGSAGSATGQGRTYRANKAEECIEKTKSLYADRAISPVKEKETTKVCERVFTGAKKKGDACAANTECEGDLTCSNAVCYEEVTKQVTEPCANPGDTCVDTAYCGQQGATKFCITKNDLNASCNEDAPCKEEFRCLSDRCVAKLGAGDPCDTSDQCTTGFCDTGIRKCATKSFAAGTTLCKQFGG